MSSPFAIQLIRRAIVLALLALSGGTNAAAADVVLNGAVERIETIVREGMEKKVASYAVGIIKDGRPVMARGFGFADLENSLPATPETVYRIGSITKQFTSMAIMQLVEQGKLSVDDELIRFLPDYPVQGHKVTIHHLLNHTSGIKSYTSLPDFFLTARLDKSHDKLLAMFKDKPFDFEPGAQMLYNNSGYYLLGMVIEKASGQSYASYLKEHIFQPLAMQATRYGDMRPIIPHRAQGYKYILGELVNDDPLSMTAPGAAGALVSNVLDLLKWSQALEAGDFLSSASYEALYRPTKLADGTTKKYGYGWMLGEFHGHRKLSHGGGINGFSTMIARYPDDRLAVIVLSNTAGAPVAKVEARIARVLLAIEERTILDLAAEEALQQRIVGNYEVTDGKIAITVENGQLYFQAQRQERDRLKYQGENQFVLANQEDVRIKFPGGDGPADNLQMETPDDTVTAKRAGP